MQLLRHVTTKKFINASSAAVYGDVETVPVEEDQVLQPTTPYGATKAGAEAYVTTYHDLKDIDVASLRFFNAYGPGQRPDSSYAGVISIFIDHFLNDERPVIYGDGEQTRDFIFVDDVAEAVVHACDASNDHEIMNIATGTETSVNAIVENLQALTGKDLEPRYEAARSSDIRRSVADTSKAEKLLDFTASTPFKDGLQTTLEWMQDRA
jgi:UDP-glucose 4-epimerase